MKKFSPLAAPVFAAFILFFSFSLFLFSPPAIAQRPPAEAAYRRVSLMGEPPPELAALAEYVTIETAQTNETLTKFWRGVSLEPDGRIGANDYGAKAAGANLVRIAPLSLPETLRILPDGTPQINWTNSDAQIKAAALRGGAIVSLSPPPALKASAWNALAKNVLLRYGKEYGAARWEFAGTREQARTHYAAFARTVRDILPDAPVGFRLTTGDPADSAAALAKFCAERKTSLDSFTWRIEAGGEDAGQTTERIRLAFAKFPELRTTGLLPDISFAAGANPAKILTLATRLMAFAPTNGKNALLGASISLPYSASRREARNAAADALALLNRMGGAKLALRLDRTDVRCLAAREAGRVRLLLWRESNSGETVVFVRLHNLAAALGGKAGVRIQRFSRPDAPDDATDTENGELELPLTLGPRSVAFIEISPLPTASVALALSSPQFACDPGAFFNLTVTLRNAGKTAVSPIVNLRSPLLGLVLPEETQTAAGSIAPGQSKALRYRLLVPPVLRGRGASLTAQVGKAQASLQFQVRSALTTTVETSRLDLSRPGQRGEARLCFQNHGLLPLALSLHAAGQREQTVTIPAGAGGISYTTEITAPSFDPGVYPVEIAIENDSGTESADSATVYIGVPVLCRYADAPPVIDANLSDWAGAERLGMGREEQTSGKAWGGPSDLSATAFTKWDANYFYFACDAGDDVFTPPTAPLNLTQADSVQFALSTDRTAPYDRAGYGAGDNEFGLALVAGDPTLLRLAGNGSQRNSRVPGAKVAIRRIGIHTLYEAAIPWAQIRGANPAPEAAFGIAVRVNDRDGNAFGAITWNAGMENGTGRHPGRFPPLRLVP